MNNISNIHSSEYLKNILPTDIYNLVSELKINKKAHLRYYEQNEYFKQYENNRQLFLENFKKDVYELGLSEYIEILSNDNDQAIHLEFLNTNIYGYQNPKIHFVNHDLYIYLSGKLPYYLISGGGHLQKEIKSEIEKKDIEIIEKYVESKGYKKIDPKLFHYPLDILGSRFLTPEEFKNEVRNEFEKVILAHETGEDIASSYTDEQLKQLRSDKKYYNKRFERYYRGVLIDGIQRLNGDYEVYYTPLHLLFTGFPD